MAAAPAANPPAWLRAVQQAGLEAAVVRAPSPQTCYSLYQSDNTPRFVISAGARTCLGTIHEHARRMREGSWRTDGNSSPPYVAVTQAQLVMIPFFNLHKVVFLHNG